MEKKCRNCNGTELVEGTDYTPIKTSKMSWNGANKHYTFCLNCGEVDSIQVSDPEK